MYLHVVLSSMPGQPSLVNWGPTGVRNGVLISKLCLSCYEETLVPFVKAERGARKRPLSVKKSLPHRCYLQFQSAHKGIWKLGIRCSWDEFCNAFMSRADIPYSCPTGACVGLIRHFLEVLPADLQPAESIDMLPLSDAMSDVASSAGDSTGGCISIG